jgi:hypothetical protein
VQSNQPFLTNDLQGALKFFGSLMALGALTIGVFIKWGQSRFSEDIKDSKTDITNLGIKVDTIDKGCIEQTARVSELSSRQDKTEVILQQVISTQGEHKSGIAGLQHQLTSLQHDMTILITSSSKAISDDVHALALKVERLDASKEERDRIGRVLEKMLSDKQATK